MSELEEKAKEILQELLDRLEIDGTVVIDRTGVSASATEEIPVTLEIKGEDLGILIGRRGQTLSSLQYIVRLILNNKTGSYLPVVIDVEGYRKRRDESLKALAFRIAEQVKTRRMPFKMEPMSPYERRVIHMALADDPDVVTASTGEGELRRVVVSLK
jgi:spoIIIJ-associated protein